MPGMNWHPSQEAHLLRNFSHIGHARTPLYARKLCALPVLGASFACKATPLAPAVLPWHGLSQNAGQVAMHIDGELSVLRQNNLADHGPKPLSRLGQILIAAPAKCKCSAATCSR